MSGGPIETVVVEDEPGFVEACVRFFVEAAARALDERGRFVVALTGGSTPVPVHRALVRADVDWPRVHVFFGDERAVPLEAKPSNYRAANDDLLRHVPLLPAHVHRMQAEREDLDAAARDYERVLLEVCNGELDLLFLGIGKDAHVLSLFPGSPHIDARDRLVAASIDPPMDPALSRVTMTPLAIERAREVLAMARGAEKAEAIERTLRGDDDPRRVPSHLIRRAKRARLVVDRAAHGRALARP